MFSKKITCCYLYPITKYGYPPPAEKTITYLEEMHALGFSSVELEGIREEHLLKIYAQRHEIKKKLDELGLNIRYFCAVLPELSSMDKNIRQHHIELFEKGCRIANTLGAKGILDNGPIPPYQFEKGIPVLRHYSNDDIKTASLPGNFEWKDFLDELADTFKILCDIASKYKLTYQIHPATGVITNTAESFLGFYNLVGRDNLKFNFDTANLFTGKENIYSSLTALKDHITYIHLSDNHGTKVEHLEAGKGKIEWNKFFESLDKIDFNGDIGIDVGGEETEIDDLDEAYKATAKFLEVNWIGNKE
jgi:sugar phosphate isomerase/epimerase